MRKRVLLAALAALALTSLFIWLDGRQWLRDRLRAPEVRRAFELEKTACLADRRGGRPIYFWTHEKLAATIRELGRLRLGEVVPDLTLLLDNEILPNACIDALGAIANDQALFALAGRALSTEHFDGEREAGEQLRRIAVPLYPILVRALSSRNPLLRRRGAILLGKLPSRFRLIRASPEAAARLFALPSEPASALLPLLLDSDAGVRFEAVRSFLSLGGSEETARSMLAEESNLSIRERLDGWTGALDRRGKPSHSVRLPHYYLAVRSAATHGFLRPGSSELGHVSEWRTFRNGLEIRISLPEATLTLPEPQFELNRPVWIRAEIRNPGSIPRTLRDADSDAPFVTLWLRDAFGQFEYIRRAEVEVVAVRLGGSGPAKVTLNPGDVAIVELNLIRGLSELRFNGKYGIALSAKGAEPVILELSVRGLPEPAWIPQSPGPLGIDPTKIYFEGVDLDLSPTPPDLRQGVLVSPTSRGVDERLAPETEATLRRFLATGDRQRLYALTRFHSAKEISTKLQQLAPTIAPSSETGLSSPTSRRATGLLRSDLDFLGRQALSEALQADERGETLAAMERFVWLIENSRDLGDVLNFNGAGSPSTWIQQRFRRGDADVRQRLWEIAAERPLVFASDSSLLGLLAGEIGPQERVERATAISKPTESGKRR